MSTRDKNAEWIHTSDRGCFIIIFRPLENVIAVTSITASSGETVVTRKCGICQSSRKPKFCAPPGKCRRARVVKGMDSKPIVISRAGSNPAVDVSFSQSFFLFFFDVFSFFFRCFFFRCFFLPFFFSPCSFRGFFFALCMYFTLIVFRPAGTFRAYLGIWVTMCTHFFHEATMLCTCLGKSRGTQQSK